MPTHGQWEWTQRALVAVRDHTDVPYEVIVCDNGSDASMRAELRRVQNVTLVLNDKNLGFATACNKGAARASGSNLVFLNSDALVHGDWVRPLVSHLDKDDRIGIVGPMLLNVDGSVQEAGATVLGDSLTLMHGYGAPRTSPRYSFARAADYVSGACLAIRRSTFHALAGFDSAFGLGYFEDADLCFEARRAGYDVIYEPRSLVTHARGASTRREDVEETFARNRTLFGRRWHDVLRHRPPGPADAALDLRVRDLAASARFLVVAGRSPARTAQIVRELARLTPRAVVTLVQDDAGAPTPARDIELLDRSGLEERLALVRHQLDVIVYLDLDDADLLGPLLDETQPQARRIVDVDDLRASRLDAVLLVAAEAVLASSAGALDAARHVAPSTPAFLVPRAQAADLLAPALAACGVAPPSHELPTKAATAVASGVSGAGGG